jgi:hypothetical protein
MKRTHGPENSALWLLADSNPIAWQDKLEGPLDSRHPTRHNIWTPIEQVIQRQLFQQCQSRMTDELFIRNAVGDSSDKSQMEPLAHEITEYGRLLSEHKPVLVLCFGEFAFEFARRARQEEGQAEFRSWSVKQLAEEFSNRICNFQVEEVNVLPLLHASIARGKFLHCHKEFSGGQGNYFDYVGGKIANVLIEYRTHDRLKNCWT